MKNKYVKEKKCTFVKMGTKTHQLGNRPVRVTDKVKKDRAKRLKEFKNWF